ncbi:MAG TPA: hypothetical protein VKQ36_10805, partial [Ktedonobacterales bacterium]|nr:hypothetical protein [Ktedonobacterales bacterium]
LLAQVATLRLAAEARQAMEGALTMAFEGEDRAAELAKVRRYLGDPEGSIVPLQRELADVVAAQGKYPVD